MLERKSKGTCELCGTELDANSMAEHLAECIEKFRHDYGRDEDYPPEAYHIAIQSARAPMYWMQVMVRAKASLSHLDSFLRRTWMNDREKRSRFTIGPRVFTSQRAGDRLGGQASQVQDMSPTLEDVIEGDRPFQYEFDLESTTKLILQVVGLRDVLPDDPETMVRLLARNHPPEIPCQCGATAERLCPDCASGPEGWLCEACAAEHSCRDEVEDYPAIQNTPRAAASA